MRFIAGLGNPGKEYVFTRHNLGFLVVEELARRHNVLLKKRTRFNARLGSAVIEGENCYLALPFIYMNLSGNSVRSVANWLKADWQDILIVLDDIALPFGKIRVRQAGSDGGHKGLASVIDCMGTDEIPRMRIGIKGEGADRTEDLARYVLDEWTEEEKKELPGVIDCAVTACECWVKDGIEKAMNLFNADPPA